jgi:ssDNA-binding replication factor A large subunit
MLIDEPERIVSEIEKHTKLQRAEILARMKKKQEEFAGLINDAAAAYALAREMGIAVEDKQAIEFSKLSEVSAGAGSVNAVARVLHIFPVRTFERNGRQGRVCNIAIADESGSATLVLWDRDVELVEKGAIERDALLEIRGAHVKQARQGVELHAGMSTSVVKRDVLAGARLPVKISELRSESNDVDVYCRITDEVAAKEFERNGAKSELASCTVADDSGAVRLVAWEQNAAALKRFKKGDAVKVESGYAKQAQRGLELHVGKKGRIAPTAALLPALDELTATPSAQFAELKAGDVRKVSAKITEFFRAVQYSACASCKKRIDVEKCPFCGGVAAQRYALSVMLDDTTMALNAVMFGDTVKKFLKVNALADDISPEVVANLKKEELVGKQVSAIARAKTNALNGQLEIVLEEIL